MPASGVPLPPVSPEVYQRPVVPVSRPQYCCRIPADDRAQNSRQVRNVILKLSGKRRNDVPTTVTPWSVRQRFVMPNNDYTNPAHAVLFGASPPQFAEFPLHETRRIYPSRSDCIWRGKLRQSVSTVRVVQHFCGLDLCLRACDDGVDASATAHNDPLSFASNKTKPASTNLLMRY